MGREVYLGFYCVYIRFRSFLFYNFRFLAEGLFRIWDFRLLWFRDY